MSREAFEKFVRAQGLVSDTPCVTKPDSAVATAFKQWAKLQGHPVVIDTYDGNYVFVDARHLWAAWQAATAAAVPPGYVVVPVEPTEERLRQGVKAACCKWTPISKKDFSNAYAAMTQPAPKESGS